MTKQQPSTNSAKESTNFNPEPPTYNDIQQRNSLEKSKSSEPCRNHGSTPVPNIDTQLQKPAARAALKALSDALADAVDENKCTKCAADSAALALTTFARDMRAAKKDGQLSKDDKKALKSEMKWLFKGLKQDMKDTWKGRSMGGVQG